MNKNTSIHPSASDAAKENYLEHTGGYLREIAKRADHFGFSTLAYLVGMAALEIYDLREMAKQTSASVEIRRSAGNVNTPDMSA
jgi:hypothetical protein